MANISNIKLNDVVYTIADKRLDLLYPTPQKYGAKGDGVTDDTQAFMDCLSNNDGVYIPKGTYIISSPLVFTTPKTIIGEDRDGVTIKALNTFAPTQVEGVTVNALIGFIFNLNNQTLGRSIINVTLDCNRICGGILLHSVVDNMLVRDVNIIDPLIGIKSEEGGWGHSYENCNIIGAINNSISLGYASNGVNISNCKMFGKLSRTDCHLWCGAGSPIIVNGGYIEKGKIGAYVRHEANVTFIGVDFEDFTEDSITCAGEISGSSLITVGEPVLIEGCTFAIANTTSPYVRNVGSKVDINGCTFLDGSGKNHAAITSNGYGNKECNTIISNCLFKDWTTKYAGDISTNGIDDNYLGATVPVGSGSAVYLRHGKSVTVQCSINLTSPVTDYSTAVVTGLPIPVVANSPVLVTNITNNHIYFGWVNASGNIVINTALGSGASIEISGTYISLP